MSWVRLKGRRSKSRWRAGDAGGSGLVVVGEWCVRAGTATTLQKEKVNQREKFTNFQGREAPGDQWSVTVSPRCRMTDVTLWRLAGTCLRRGAGWWGFLDLGWFILKISISCSLLFTTPQVPQLCPPAEKICQEVPVTSCSNKPKEVCRIECTTPDASLSKF